jgi:hypothetical protein
MEPGTDSGLQGACSVSRTEETAEFKKIEQEVHESIRNDHSHENEQKQKTKLAEPFGGIWDKVPIQARDDFGKTLEAAKAGDAKGSTHSSSVKRAVRTTTARPKNIVGGFPERGKK